MNDTPTGSELNARFLKLVSGAELDGLRRVAQLADSLDDVANRVARWPDRPELRQPPPPLPLAYRIRVHLTGFHPPVWRLLELRSDSMLDWLHSYLSTILGLDPDHLYRFSLGGPPLAPDSQLFCCDSDDEAEQDPCASTSECADVRLDEAIQAPGEVFYYTNGLDGGTPATIRLEASFPSDGMLEPVLVLDGAGMAHNRRPKGPGNTPSDETRVGADLRRANHDLRGPCGKYGSLSPRSRRLRTIIDTLTGTESAANLRSCEERLHSRPAHPPDPVELVACLKPFDWFLGSVDDGRLTLTTAGYLTPGMVRQARERLPRRRPQSGRGETREMSYPEVRRFRESLRALGLVRITDGRLHLTESGRTAIGGPEALWEALVTALPRGKDFERDATLLILLVASACPDRELDLDTVVTALRSLGWQVDDAPVSQDHLWQLAVIEILGNVASGPAPVQGRRVHISPTAASLASLALAGAR